MDASYYRLKNKLDEIYLIEPNDLGYPLLTRFYKRFTVHLKSMPFLLIVPSSIFISMVMYVLLGALLVKLATILQYGF